MHLSWFLNDEDRWTNNRTIPHSLYTEYIEIIRMIPFLAFVQFEAEFCRIRMIHPLDIYTEQYTINVIKMARYVSSFQWPNSFPRIISQYILGYRNRTYMDGFPEQSDVIHDTMNILISSKRAERPRLQSTAPVQPHHGHGQAASIDVDVAIWHQSVPSRTLRLHTCAVLGVLTL